MFHRQLASALYASMAAIYIYSAIAIGAPPAAAATVEGAVKVCVDPSMRGPSFRMLDNGFPAGALDSANCVQVSLRGGAGRPISMHPVSVTFLAQPPASWSQWVPLLAKQPRLVTVEVPIQSYNFPLDVNYRVSLRPILAMDCTDTSAPSIPRPEDGIDDDLTNLNQWAEIYDDCLSKYPDEPSRLVYPYYMYLSANYYLIRKQQILFGSRSSVTDGYDVVFANSPCNDSSLDNAYCKSIKKLFNIVKFKELLYYDAVASSVSYSKDHPAAVTGEDLRYRSLAIDLVRAAATRCTGAGLQLASCGADLQEGWIDNLQIDNCDQMSEEQRHGDAHCGRRGAVDLAH
jgi:hypothetical protein